jgi:hypothetical protein
MKNAKELMLEYTASSDESGDHSREENLTNNVNEKNKRLVLDAKTLLLEFLAAITHGQDAAALFAEDGAVELPFLHSVGIPWRHRGRRANQRTPRFSLRALSGLRPRSPCPRASPDGIATCRFKNSTWGSISAMYPRVRAWPQALTSPYKSRHRCSVSGTGTNGVITCPAAS